MTNMVQMKQCGHAHTPQDEGVLLSWVALVMLAAQEAGVRPLQGASISN